MFKTRFISMLVLLMTAVSGAWAQDTYKIDAVCTYTANGQSQSQDLSIDDAASLPFTIKLSELDPFSMSNVEYNLVATNITVSGDNIVKGTDANWDTEITINGAGTATVSYGIQHSDYGELGSVTITFTVTKNAPAASTYTVTLKEGTDDADNWTITPAEATTTGVAAGTEVKATYGGTKKVKSVKAVKKAAPAPAEETVTWDNTNVFVSGNSEVTADKDNPYTYGGVSISFSGASWLQLYDSGQDVTKLIVRADAVCTFTAPSGKKFTKIEITDNFYATFTAYGDWAMDGEAKAIWSGTASNTVTLGSSENSFFTNLKSIVFTMEEAAAPAPTLAETLTTAGMTVKVNYNYNGGENSCSFLSNGDGTYTFQSGEGNAGDSDRAKALVVEGGKLVFKQNFYSSFDNMYDLFGFSVTFDTSNNTYSLWLGLMAESNVNPSFISVEVNGTQIAVTAAQ